MTSSGIPPAAFDYFRTLERHNDQDWWHEHRDLWDDGVHAPLERLAEQLAPEFGELAVSRPSRDIRFTKDKTPYQGFAALTRTSPDRAALYLQLDARGLLVAAGLWKPRPEQLRRFRSLADDEEAMGEWEALLARMRRHRLPLGDAEPLTGTPRGWSADHPRIDLLRTTRLVVERSYAPAGWMATGECRRRVRAAWRAGEEFNAWLDRRVGGGSIERRAGDDL